MNWQQAEDWCLDNYGTHLASIHDDDEWAEAAAVCATNQCWLGGTRQDNGDWAWSDSSSWDYTHWHPSQPDDHLGNDDCIQQYRNEPGSTNSWHQGLWGDQRCDISACVPLCAAPGSVPSPGSSHWIAAGNPLHDDWIGIPNVECAGDARTQATEATFGPGDTDIGVSCCTEDGSNGVRKFGDGAECQQAKTYDEAEAICVENGYRLCSLDEMLGLATKWKGCYHDSRYNWVSNECGQSTAHRVIQGKPSWDGWEDSNPDDYCQSDDNHQAAYQGEVYDLDIGVGCCSMDGTSGDRPHCNLHPFTYEHAVGLCSEYNMRLCTLEEMRTEITAGTGCSYDGAYLWTLDECDASSDASASSNVYGTSKGTTADGDSKSFDDFIPMVLGAAGGIAVSASIVALVVAMRRKKVTEEAVTEMSDVVHIPDTSATVDGTVTASC